MVTDMTLSEIYEKFNAGSPGFVDAVQSHCGLYASDAEIERIADLADDADSFQHIWENDDSWTDENNGETDENAANKSISCRPDPTVSQE